jgi:hypothetical protein
MGWFAPAEQTLNDYGAPQMVHHMSEPMRLQNARNFG